MSELRIAVLGVGMMGAFHAEALSSRIKGARVTVINDFFEEKAAEIANRIGARVVADPLQAIADAEVDAVLIATPGAAHEDQVNACLEAGVPVLCEKPLTTDIESSYRIVQKEAALDQPLVQVGFMRRFDAEYVALKDLIDGGGLGNPLMLHCTHRNPAVGDHFNSEFMIRDSVVHEVDAARFLLGEEIVSVQVIKGAATSIAPDGTNDPMLVIFETESGRIVTDEIYVRTQVAYEVRTEVVGERGSAFIGLDQHLQAKTTDGRWGGQLTPELRREIRPGVRHRTPALGGGSPTGDHRWSRRLGRLRRCSRLRGRRTGAPDRSKGGGGARLAPDRASPPVPVEAPPDLERLP